MATWKKKKSLYSQTVAEIEKGAKKAFVDFLILALGEKLIWLEWIVKLANAY